MTQNLINEGPLEAPSPADPAAAPDHAWYADITRRLRVLLHAEPLFRLKIRGDAQLGEDHDLGHYDSLALVFKIFDVVLERTGLESEIDTKGIARELAPVLGAMDAAKGIAPDTERHERATDRVVGWLLNESGRREPYTVDYTDFGSGGSALPRVMGVSFMYEEFTPTGKYVPRLSAEATNLYLNAIDFPIEDRQVAFESMIRSQIRRGRFREAVHSAQAALALSVQLRQKLEEILRMTQKDITQVDWAHSVPALLREARDHVHERATAERDIIAAAEDKLNFLEAGTSESREVARVIFLIEACYKQHTLLEDRLIGALPTFLDEHARQAFVPRRSVAAVDLKRDVLLPLLGGQARKGRAVAPLLVASLHPPVAPGLLSIDDLVTRLLQPRREIRPHTAEMPLRELQEIVAERLRYDAATWQAAERWLQRIGPEPVALDVLVGQARAAGECADVLDLVVLRALYSYAGDFDLPDRIYAEKTGAGFKMGSLVGDNLELRKLGVLNAVGV